MSASQRPRCKYLVLDAGPLLSLSPLRGLAETYCTTAQVLAELKDKRAREHFERLGLNAGVKIEIMEPHAASLAQAIQCAKKTGDYSVLSHADLCVIALTHDLAQQTEVDAGKPDEPIATGAPGSQDIVQDVPSARDISASEDELHDVSEKLHDLVLAEGSEVPSAETGEALEPLDVELHPISDESTPRPSSHHIPNEDDDAPLFEDPSDSDDGEGEWITPANVALHKSRALGLIPDDPKTPRKGRQHDDELVTVGCMTADFAMQNVILQMGLNLVSVDGKRIQKVKNWVLRCHACFKICKDSSRQFCPSCGNPSLIRASVTVCAPNASSDAPAMQVHLKPNFQYKIRGTKYSIPTPKPGSAKTGAGEGLILREDQSEYVKARQRAENKRAREDQKLMKGIFDKGNSAGVAAFGSWMDPDWVPEIISVGSGGKGRTLKGGHDMPTIGYGKRNPNERRRK